MKIKSQREFWSGLVFIVVGVVFALRATHFPMGSSATPGVGYFPLVLSVIMAILGALVLFKSLTLEVDGGDPIGRFAWRPLLVIGVAIAFFGFAIERLGLFVTVPVLICVSSGAAAGFRWKGVLVNAVVLTIGSWLVFVVVLKLRIPIWPWFLQ